MKYKNVYFINGNAYAGKSTMIKLLSDKYNGILCEENYQDRKLETLNKKDFPALTYIRNLKVKDIDETIDKFIEYYNNKRLQEKIKELTPFEFRELTLNSVFF